MSMHPIKKMFDEYVSLRNAKVNPDDFATHEDYEHHVYSIEAETEAIYRELQQNGCKPVFTHLDDDGVYHYALKDKQS